MVTKTTAVLGMGKDYFKNEQEIEEFVTDNNKLMEEFDKILSLYKSKYKTNHVVCQIVRDIRDILEAKEGENIREIAQIRMDELKKLRMVICEENQNLKQE